MQNVCFSAQTCSEKELLVSGSRGDDGGWRSCLLFFIISIYQKNSEAALGYICSTKVLEGAKQANPGWGKISRSRGTRLGTLRTSRVIFDALQPCQAKADLKLLLGPCQILRQNKDRELAESSQCNLFSLTVTQLAVFTQQSTGQDYEDGFKFRIPVQSSQIWSTFGASYPIRLTFRLMCFTFK